MSTTQDRQEHPWSAEELHPAAAGLLMALSFAPFNLSVLAFVALVPLFLYLDRPPARTRVVRAGLITGTVFFGIHLSWLVAVGSFSWLAFPGYAVIVFFHVCNFFFFVLSVVVLEQYLSVPFLYSAPFAWVVSERLRGYGDVAFPWTQLGYALTPFPFFLQFADLVGVYGVSFWLVALNLLLFEAVRRRARPARSVRALILWLVAFGAVNGYNAFRWYGGLPPPAGYLEVAVVQPNVPQRIKWDDRYSREIVADLFALHAAAARPGTDLVVWPETAIPYYVDERSPFKLTEMGELPADGPPVVSGLLGTDTGEDGRRHFYNSAALFGPGGELRGRYHKIHLVPGSEQFPFRRLLGFARSFFRIQGNVPYGLLDAGHELTVFSLPRARFAAMICYESAFPQLSRGFRLGGSDFLVSITNDAWFGRSLAPYQHASFLVLRAIENRVAIVRSGNTGVSGFVDPRGRWRERSDLFTKRIVSGRIPLATARTFYTRFGDLTVQLSYSVMGVFLVLAVLRKYSVDLKVRRGE